MEIITQNRQNSILMALNGSLDIYTSLELKETLETLVNSKEIKNIIIDLDFTDYVDSSGIGTLIKGLNLAREKKIEFYIVNVQPTIEKVFKVAGLLNFFKILSRQELIEQFPE